MNVSWSTVPPLALNVSSDVKSASTTQGCGPLLPGQNEAELRQDLKGNTRPGAPEWSGFIAANYERQLGSSFMLGISANVQYKDVTVLS